MKVEYVKGDKVTGRPENPCGEVTKEDYSWDLPVDRFGAQGLLQNWSFQPMRWQPSGNLVKDIGSHVQLPRSGRAKIYGAIREMVERSWPAGRMPELALCMEVGELSEPSRHSKQAPQMRML